MFSSKSSFTTCHVLTNGNGKLRCDLQLEFPLVGFCSTGSRCLNLQIVGNLSFFTAALFHL